MAVKIRLARIGKTNKAFYRVVAIEEGLKRDGPGTEVLGTYDPHEKVKSEKLKIQVDRLNYWLSVGAKPTKTVHELISRISN